jgi:hypothetical protein
MLLKGDMSIVGPRPTLYSDRYSSLDPRTKKRYKMRPRNFRLYTAIFVIQIGRKKNSGMMPGTLTILPSFRYKVLLRTITSVIKRE